MSTLPFTLPTCDQPATVRIEVYSIPAGTLPDSLDASVYSCREHAADAVTAIEAAGMQARVVPMTADIARTCGHVHVFPTGTLPSGGEHPSWCDRQGCADRGEHRSAAMAVKPYPEDLTAMTVRLVQLIAATATPVLMELAFIAEDPDDTSAQLVTVAQAVALTYRIRGLADRAKGRRP